MFNHIKAIFWYHLNQQNDWPDQSIDLYAIWPGPIDSDVCFQNAGFNYFADTTDDWNKEYALLGSLIFNQLYRIGPVSLARPQKPYKNRFERRFVRDVYSGLNSFPELEMLLISASDDRYGPVQCDFGSPAKASMIASDGHPIFWLKIDKHESHQFAEWVFSLAQYAPLQNKALNWSFLFPNV